ncbi:MAG: TrbI/VirB10 family protein [Acidobacteria bacterium]|nr:TrbI/VirB10 family protein [Acidobacteriota bacterium]
MSRTLRWRMWILGCAVLAAGAAAQGQVVTLPAGTTLQVVLETHLNTKDSKSGDSFRSRLVLPVFVDEQEVLPIGGIVEGTVVRVQGPGRVSGKAEMQLRPEKIILPNGDEMPLSATIAGGTAGENTTVDSDEGTVQASGKKGMDTRGTVGSAATGAIMGAVIADQAGAGIGAGAAIGAGAIVAVAVLRQIFKKGNDADLPAGSEISLELNRSLTFNPTMQEVPPAPARNAESRGTPREDRRPELTRQEP